VFPSATVEGTPVDVTEPDPLDWWKFAEPPPNTIAAESRATWGWKAYDAVSGLKLRDGRLTGRTSGALPVLAASRFTSLDESDLLHAVEIRMRVSAGTTVTMAAWGEAELKTPELIGMLRGAPFRLQSPILPGDEFHTYTLQPPIAQPLAQMKHLIVVPTDAAGADFEIDSIRVISRREHLARIPSGVGWQGLSEIYRETVVARSPEVIHLPLEVPHEAWLELHVGTIEHDPVTFRVGVSAGGEETPLLVRTVTVAHRWETVPLDLAAYGGRNVTLNLGLAADDPGKVGFWGGVTLRRRAPASPVATDRKAVSVLGEAAGRPPQGVILVVADTLRRDHLNFHGYSRETAPFLAQLAASGTLFEDNIAQATWTKVSVPSMLTSLYPTSNRIHDIPDRLSAQATTLAEIFREAGYATVAYSSVPFTGKLTNLHQGFEELHEVTSVRAGESRESKTAREYVDRLTRWLELHGRGPFFVFLHVFDPHDPYEPFQPYNSLWADLSRKPEHEQQLETVRKFIEDPLLKRFGMPSREEFRAAGVDGDAFVAYDKDWYDGSIRGMDREIARLVERLGQLGLKHRTLLVFTSDHGEEFLEHGRTFHGQNLYGELTNVPLFFHWEGVVPANLQIQKTVQNVDIMPTVLALSHLPVPSGIAGQDLLPLMASKQPGGSSASLSASAAELRPAISERLETRALAGPPPRGTASVALVLDGWKLIHNYQRVEGQPEYELYRHREDPLNFNNVAADNPEVVSRLASALEKWREAALAAQLPEADSTEGLSREELERLRSLGYVQ
jgi:arylsulfatase A-like enzyme